MYNISTRGRSFCTISLPEEEVFVQYLYPEEEGRSFCTIPLPEEEGRSFCTTSLPEEEGRSFRTIALPEADTIPKNLRATQVLGTRMVT